jgi:hypothetical protein
MKRLLSAFLLVPCLALAYNYGHGTYAKTAPHFPTTVNGVQYDCQGGPVCAFTDQNTTCVSSQPLVNVTCVPVDGGSSITQQWCTTTTVQGSQDGGGC